MKKLPFLLMALQDLEATEEDVKREDYRSIFPVPHQAIEREKERLRDEIRKMGGERVLERYERLKQQYGKAIVLTVGGICFHCFAVLPTSLEASHEGGLLECPNCGIFLYQTDEEEA